MVSEGLVAVGCWGKSKIHSYPCKYEYESALHLLQRKRESKTWAKPADFPPRSLLPHRLTRQPSPTE